MFKVLINGATAILLVYTSPAIAQVAEHGHHHDQVSEKNELRIDMESRNYRPGEGVYLSFKKPVKVTAVRVLTSGHRNATLTATIDGNTALTSDGRYMYTYRGQSHTEWVTFTPSYPRYSTRIELNFGKDDPKIDEMILEYESPVRTVVEYKWVEKKIYITRSLLGEKIDEIISRFEALKPVFMQDAKGTAFYEQAYGLLYRAKVRAKTHDGSDPDTRVGAAVNDFLNDFACQGVLDVYGFMAYKNIGPTADLFEALGISIFQLADLRRYEPTTCGVFMNTWLSKP